MNRFACSRQAFKMKPDAESVTSRTIGTEEDERLSNMEASFPCVDFSEESEDPSASKKSKSKLTVWLYKIHDDRFVLEGTQVQRLGMSDLQAHQRPIPTVRLGKAMATLHYSNKPLNLMFRKWSRSKLNTFFAELDLTALVEDEGNMDRAAQQALDFGAEACEQVQSNMQEILKNSMWDCPLGGLPRVCFSSMARDVGMPLTYPIASAMAYAIQGDTGGVVDSIHSFDQFWNAYVLQRRREGFVAEDLLFHTCKNGVGWCAFFLYVAYYKRKAFTDLLPLRPVGQEDRGIVIETIGLVALRLMHCCFGPETSAGMTVDDLKTEIDAIIDEETDTLTAVYMVNHEHRRRSSKKAQKQKQPTRAGGRYGRAFGGPRRSGSLVKRRDRSLASSFVSDSSESRWQTDSCENIRTDSLFKPPRQRLPSVFESTRLAHNEESESLNSSAYDRAESPQRVPLRLPTDALRTSGSFLSIHANSIHASPTRLPRRLPSIVMGRGSFQSVANSELSDRWFNEGSFASQSALVPQRLPSLCKNRNSMSSLRNSMASMSSLQNSMTSKSSMRNSMTSSKSSRRNSLTSKSSLRNSMPSLRTSMPSMRNSMISLRNSMASISSVDTWQESDCVCSNSSTGSVSLVSI